MPVAEGEESPPGCGPGRGQILQTGSGIKHAMDLASAFSLSLFFPSVTTFSSEQSQYTVCNSSVWFKSPEELPEWLVDSSESQRELTRVLWVSWTSGHLSPFSLSSLSKVQFHITQNYIDNQASSS